MSSVGDSIEAFLQLMMVIVVVFVPLGLWKMVEIAIYLYRNITISWGTP